MQHNPISPETSLWNIASGVTANASVDVHQAVSVAMGNNIIRSMEGQIVCEYSFKRANQVTSMEFKSVKGQDAGQPVDPQLLFQRVVTTGLRCDEVEDVFSYELCAYPTALFESRYCMRQGQKAWLRTAL